MASPNPYEAPRSDSPQPAPPSPADGLWPRSRRRRERLVQGTLRAWLLLGLRALIFVIAIAAVIILLRQAQQ
jgi:hypothetical protein